MMFIKSRVVRFYCPFCVIFVCVCERPGKWRASWYAQFSGRAEIHFKSFLWEAWLSPYFESTYPNIEVCIFRKFIYSVTKEIFLFTIGDKENLAVNHTLWWQNVTFIALSCFNFAAECEDSVRLSAVTQKLNCETIHNSFAQKVLTTIFKSN